MSRKRNQVGWATKRYSVTRAQSQHAYLQETFTTSNLRRKLQVIGNINPKGVARLKHACKSVIISLGIAHQYKHLSGLATASGRRFSGALGWSKSERAVTHITQKTDPCRLREQQRTCHTSGFRLKGTPLPWEADAPTTYFSCR